MDAQNDSDGWVICTARRDDFAEVLALWRVSKSVPTVTDSTGPGGTAATKPAPCSER
jgi:hypothetical protein